MVAADGSGRTLDVPWDSCQSAPIWSPDGRTPAVIDEQGWLCTMSNDGTSLRRLARADWLDDDCWSPDGTKLLYRRDDTVYTIGANGHGETPVRVRQPYVEMYSCGWSPDGSRIALVIGSETEFSVYTARPDGSDLRLVVHNAPEVQWLPCP